MVDHVALAAVMDQFAATVTGDFSSVDILRQLAQAATRVLDVDGVGVMAPRDGQLLRFVFATSGPVSELERLQEELQAGPCNDVHDTDMVISIGDLATQGDWPEYQEKAVDLGLRCVAAIPLRARGLGWGVLDLYRVAARELSAQELEAARTLANLATSYLVVTEDRDAARRAQDELAYRAMHDPLTGLPVRWVFLEQLGHALSRLQRKPGHVGVLFVDLDGLKYVNDTYGHLAGDRLIITCVKRIRAALRPSDVLARIGGDEFVILLEEIDTPAAAELVANRIMDELARPYQPDGETMQPSASVGVTTTADFATKAEALIAHADAAMYQAKRLGRGRYQVFDPALYTQERSNGAVDQLSTALRAALRTDQLELHYQPVLDLTDAAGPTGSADRSGGEGEVGFADGRLWAVEALARWQHPTQGLLRAGDFIDAAERAGLMVDLGTWVLNTACQQMADWDARLGPRAPQRVLVNLSVHELAHPALNELVEAAAGRARVSPSRLTIEITETGLFSDPQATMTAVRSLSDLGCHFAIDDFGTGYSSLSRLVQVPGAALKLDQSFSRTVRTNPDTAAVVSSVLQLGRTLRRTVIVEGVEDAETCTTLWQLGCTHFQGFHLALPESAEGIAARLMA